MEVKCSRGRAGNEEVRMLLFPFTTTQVRLPCPIIFHGEHRGDPEPLSLVGMYLILRAGDSWTMSLVHAWECLQNHDEMS